MLVTNILLAGVLIILVGCIVAIWSIYGRILTTIATWTTQPDEKTPSPLGNFVDTIAQMFARALVALVKTTQMGELSGVVRAEKAVNSAIAEDLVSQQPVLSAILQQFPALKKTLRRNPQLMDMAIQSLSKIAPGSGSRSGNNSNGPQFRLGV